MSAKNPLGSSRFLNGILTLGVLMGLGGMAGIVATALTESSGHGSAVKAALPAFGALTPARIDGKYGYVDAQGAVVIAPRFDGADTFSEGLALVLEQGRFGYIDADGRFAIPAVFRHALPFRNGFAPVRNGSDWAYLDRSGNPVAFHEEGESDDSGTGAPGH
jgi:hypothetical protein